METIWCGQCPYIISIMHHAIILIQHAICFQKRLYILYTTKLVLYFSPIKVRYTQWSQGFIWLSNNTQHALWLPSDLCPVTLNKTKFCFVFPFYCFLFVMWKPPEKWLFCNSVGGYFIPPRDNGRHFRCRRKIKCIGLTSSTNRPASLCCGCLSSFQQWNIELPQAVIQVLMLSRGQARVCSVCST